MAVGLDHVVCDGGELTAQPCIPIAHRPLAQTLEFPLHRLLLVFRRAKGGECRVLGIHMIRRVVRRSRERRIHYHQTLTQRSHFHFDEIAPPLGPQGHLLAQRKHYLMFRGAEIEKIERSKIDDWTAILVLLDDWVAVIVAFLLAFVVEHSDASKRVEDVPRALVLLARRDER